MSEKEKKEFYVAMCKCCLIAQAMKTCSLCQFKIGLAEPVNTASPISVQNTIFALSERSEFNNVSA